MPTLTRDEISIATARLKKEIAFCETVARKARRKARRFATLMKRKKRELEALRR